MSLETSILFQKSCWTGRLYWIKNYHITVGMWISHLFGEWFSVLSMNIWQNYYFSWIVFNKIYFLFHKRLQILFFGVGGEGWRKDTSSSCLSDLMSLLLLNCSLKRMNCGGKMFEMSVRPDSQYSLAQIDKMLSMIDRII